MHIRSAYLHSHLATGKKQLELILVGDTEGDLDMIWFIDSYCGSFFLKILGHRQLRVTVNTAPIKAGDHHCHWMPRLHAGLGNKWWNSASQDPIDNKWRSFLFNSCTCSADIINLHHQNHHTTRWGGGVAFHANVRGSKLNARSSMKLLCALDLFGCHVIIKLYLAGGFKYLFVNVHPDPWGNDPINWVDSTTN